MNNDLLQFLENFNETAILFSYNFKNEIQTIYNNLLETFPTKNIYLVPSKEILCSSKVTNYESYILVGIECPIHRFKNAFQFKIDLKENFVQKIQNFKGNIVFDSIYGKEDVIKKPEDDFLVVTENQLVLDYYSYKYENVEQLDKKLDIKSRVKFLMKENIKANKLNEKKMVGVIFTSPIFEDIASSLVNKINTFSTAYKIFLKDISYERLISIDNIDCIVLVDCPFFQCTFDLHIPVLSPFSVECFITEKWNDQYNRNSFDLSENKEVAIQSHLKGHAGELMEKRWFKGVVYETEEEDFNIYEGKKGIATEYENEGKI